MKNRIRTVFSLVLLALFLMTACSRQVEVEDTQTEKKDDELTVGMSFDSFLIERWQRDRDVFVDQCKSLGAKVNVQNANGDINQQISQIDYLISKRVDCIVIVGIDADSLHDVCNRAHQAGIPIIAYDRMIHNGNVDLYISFDNKQVGRLMGEGLVKSRMSKKEVLVLAGPTEDPNVEQIDEGFREVLKENGINIKAQMHTPGWKPEYAAEYMNKNFSLLDDVGGIMCGNDGIATAVYGVLAERRCAGKIKMVGQDADLEACQRIVQGTQVMTVFKPVEKLARAAADYAVRLAKGEELTDVEDTFSDGSHDVPYVMLDPIAVYKYNMDETVIDAGYHLKEDVYLYAGK